MELPMALFPATLPRSIPVIFMLLFAGVALIAVFGVIFSKETWWGSVAFCSAILAILSGVAEMFLRSFKVNKRR